MSIEEKINNNEIKLNEIKDPNTEKFLFLVVPEKIDTECIGGITLKNGVRILSVIILYEALSSLSLMFDTKYYTKYLFYLLFFICYLGVTSLAFISTFNDSFSLAKMAYIVLSILFILKVLFYLLKCAIRLIEFINPWDGDFLKLKLIIYILGNLAYLFVLLYFIYVLYCFMISLKKSN